MADGWWNNRMSQWPQKVFQCTAVGVHLVMAFVFYVPLIMASWGFAEMIYAEFWNEEELGGRNLCPDDPWEQPRSA